MVAGATFGLLVFFVAVGLTLPWTSPRVEELPPGGMQISRIVLEKRFGIQLEHIAVSHSGGLVELRFTVLDAMKAKQLVGATPRLISSETGYSLQAPENGPWRSIRLQKDASCFVLFPNARGTIKPGSRVSLSFGGLRVEPVVAM
jgi:hypothetical protein